MKYREDIRTLFVVAFAIGLHVIAWVPLGWQSVLVFSLINFLLLVISHNQVHNGIFRRPAYNRLFELLLSVLSLGSLANMYGVHTLNHHLHADSDEDWFSSNHVKGLTGLLAMLVFPFLAFYFTIRKRSQLFAEKRFKSIHRRKQREGVISFLFLLGVFIYSPQEALFAWILPGFFAKYLLAIVNLMQHVGCLPRVPLYSSRNFLGKGLNWLLFNNGYHTAHHAKPSLHWSKLPHYHYLYLHHKLPESLIEKSLLAFVFFTYVPGKIKPLTYGATKQEK
ncbi:fatty acid desaturase [Bacteroidota bacterium]